MKNIWCLRPHDDYGYKIIDKILKNDSETVSLLTSNKEFLKKISKESLIKLKNKTFDNNEILIKKNFNQNSNYKKYLKIYSSAKFYKYRFLSIENLSRNERFYGELKFEERNSYTFDQFIFWATKFENNKPNLIVMFDLPHMYYEMIILGLAKMKKIPLLIIKHNQRNTFLFDYDFKPVKNLKYSKTFREIYKKNILNPKKTNLLKNNVNFFGNFNKLLKFSTIHLIMGIIKSIKNSTDRNSNFIKKSDYILDFNNIFNERVQNLKYLTKCMIEQYKYSNNSISYLPKKFVFLPLVSNFEADLMPGCSPWTHEKIVNLLLNEFDDDTYICIKEHPRQFKLRYHQQFSRENNFYKNLSKNKRVKFLSISSDTIKIIKKSIYVVCSSLSTTAIESLLLNKKVIYFGPDILPKDNCKKIDDLKSTNKTNKNKAISQRIYYPYKQNLKNFSNNSDDYSRYISNHEISRLVENINEYYKKNH